jgi:hypothetical protein
MYQSQGRQQMIEYRVRILTSLCLAIALGTPAQAADLLVESGQARSCIVYPEGTEKGRVLTAVHDLAGYLKSMSGATIPLRWDTDSSPGFRIMIGSTALSPVDRAAVSEANVGFDGFIIKSVPGGVVIAGRTPQGTANGVYHFAEEVLGIHWYTLEEDGPTFPDRKTIEIPTLDVTEKPDFAWRGQYYAGLQKYLPKQSVANSPRWWTFNRLWGISAETFHVFDAFVPNNLYDTHPEYFPLIDGKRLRGDLHADSSEVQRCLSNPDVLAMAIAYTAARFEKDPAIRFASLSANDAGSKQGGFCQGDNCMAMGPTPSHQLLAFANAVAEANEARYPNRGYVFYAYRHTIDPPLGMKAHRNVVPMICPLDSCRLHSLHSDCPDIARKQAAIKGWPKITGRILYRPYTSAGMFDLPTVLTMAEEMKFLRDHGSMGGFREYGGAPQANWAMLNWMEVKILWDVDQDAKKLRRQFIEGYYGPAAADAVERAYASIGNSLRGSSTVPRTDSTYGHNYMVLKFLNPFIDLCRADIDAALEIAKRESNPAFRRRIDRDMGTFLGRLAPDLKGLIEKVE